VGGGGGGGGGGSRRSRALDWLSRGKHFFLEARVEFGSGREKKKATLAVAFESGVEKGVTPRSPR
jgi:hypothetical protein